MCGVSALCWHSRCGFSSTVAALFLPPSFFICIERAQQCRLPHCRDKNSILLHFGWFNEQVFAFRRASLSFQGHFLFYRRFVCIILNDFFLCTIRCCCTRATEPMRTTTHPWRAESTSTRLTPKMATPPSAWLGWSHPTQAPTSARWRRLRASAAGRCCWLSWVSATSATKV